MNQNKHRIYMLISALVLATSALLYLQPGTAHAAVLNVPGQYSTIQAAINHADNGDVIQIANGVYRENLLINHKYITLSGNGDAQSVVLAGNGGATPLMIQNTPYVAGGKVAITGLKITGGNAPSGQGGGITLANNADADIYNNTIENNTTTDDGGGILVYNGSNPVIHNNIIRTNHATNFGGGIFVVKNSSPNISNNTITGNTVSGANIANGGSSGGGVYLEDDSSNTSLRAHPVVANNTISSNTADFAGGGIMLRVGVDAMIESNTISDNSAAYGGGIHIETEGSSPLIDHNTITNNRASQKAQFGGSGYGAGISVYSKSNPTITDNTITLNQSTLGGAGIVLAENSNSQIARNYIQNNAVTGGGFVQGGGIYISGATATATNNVISDNSAYLGGGVAAIGSNAVMTLNHNTIAYNNAGHTQGGGGLFVNNNPGTQITCINNIITANTKYQVFEQVSSGNTYPLTRFANNDITNTGSGLYFNYITNGVTSASAFDSSSSIDASSTLGADPAFTNGPTRDFSLTQSSPAINVGNDAIGDDIRLAVRSDGQSDAGAFEYTATPVIKTHVYRFFSSLTKSHFYTQSNSERDSVIVNYAPEQWQYEGVAYDAFTTNESGTVPLYRFYSQTNGSHFFTIDDNEKNALIADPTSSRWQYEGVAFYVYPQNTNAPANMVYRFWSPDSAVHFYTASVDEKNYVVANYPAHTWTYEGPRFAVPQ